MDEDGSLTADEALNILAEIGQKIRTQDGAAEGRNGEHQTIWPVYMVEQIETFGGDEWEDIPVIEEWGLVPGAVSLTRAGIEEYLLLYGRNLDEPRIHVASLYRVPEMQKLREALMALSRELSGEIER